MRFFEKHDLSQITGRVLLVGDVHGCFHLLDERLKKLAYNPTKDKLIFLGDLIDRGPDSQKAFDWIRDPNILRIIGNHEDMFKKCFDPPDHFCWPIVFSRNGGMWAYEKWKDKDEMKTAALELWDAPFALEIKTPNGHTIGIIHASVPENDWAQMSIINRSWGKHYEYLDDVNDACLWSRRHIDKLLHTGTTDEIKNIEHVFFGHTPVDFITTHKNCTWIDTKAFKTGILTILDADQFLEFVRV